MMARGGKRKGAGRPKGTGKFGEPVDLMDQLMPDPAATIYARMNDTSMTGAGIFSDDLIVADKSREPKQGDLVLVTVDGKSHVRRLQIKGKRLELKAENPKFPTIKITDDREFHIQGVVIKALHSFRISR